MTPRNLQELHAELLFDALARAGVEHLVLSPGSRSTPFVLAAARQPGLQLHDAVDERAAAFFALGAGRATGRPAALLCTSGTAPAHYYPAVIEAAAAGVPLVVLSADRPHELAACAAPQTIDQTRLFGEHVRFFADLGSPDATALSLRATRRFVAQAVHRSRWPEPGPVHLNLRARKPLEPQGAHTDDERALAALAGSVRQEPLPRAHPPRTLPDPAAIELVARALAGRRGVVACGPGPLDRARAREAVAALCRATGWPLLAESTSQLRHGMPPDVAVVGAFDHLLAAGLAEPPEVVVQIGLPPVASAWERWAARASRVVVAPHGWADPTSGAEHLLLGEVAPAVQALADALAGAPPAPDPAWLPADRLAWEAVDAELAGEGLAVRRAVEALPEGALLAVGNSLVVRQLDQFVPPRPAPVDTLSQRGVSGIDGLVAGAAGSAVAARRPVLLLLGDLSALHDLGGLALLPRDVSVCVLVLDNGGGRIFEQLPIARHPDVGEEALRRFTTPRRHDLAHAAALFGIRFADPAPEAVGPAVRDALERPGATLLQVRVPEHGAAAALAAVRARLR